MGLFARPSRHASSRLFVRLISPMHHHAIIKQRFEISRNKSRKLENLAGGDIQLSEAEMKEINDAIASHGVKGGRYNDAVPANVLRLWG
jgi:hypothetical protein